MCADRVVPEVVAMDDIPIARLEELQTHLEELRNDASITINARLLDEVELQLTETNIPPLIPILLEPLTVILKSTTQDPTPILTLTIKLLSPLPFTRLLTIADQESILSALLSPLPGANLLGLAIIHKAARSPADAAILSTLPEVVEELINRWLEASDVGVAEKAAKVIGDLLETDCEVVENPGAAAAAVATTNGISGTELVKRRLPGHGRLWNMILSTRHFLSIVVDLCSPSPPSTSETQQRTSHEITLSQGRLLRMLPRLATLNIQAITTTQFSDLFPVPETAAGCGLLQWAALAMIDKDDILMHLSIIDFFETFVSVMRVSATAAAGGRDGIIKNLVQVAVQNDNELRTALLGLADRTVEEESEEVRQYVSKLMDN